MDFVKKTRSKICNWLNSEAKRLKLFAEHQDPFSQKRNGQESMPIFIPEGKGIKSFW